jgi:hypothetical protein
MAPMTINRILTKLEPFLTGGLASSFAAMIVLGVGRVSSYQASK